MKSKSKKRILALVLSMVLMLSTGISAMAEGEAANGKTDGTTAEKTEPAAENQEVQEGSGETPDGEKPEELQEVAEAQTQTDGSQESGTEEIISEAADLYQDFQDENGNVITTIHAYVPEGAFQAKADQITMQAKLLDQESDNYIKGMIEEKLPENSYLGGYVLYEVNFMVDGVITEPAKAITLTIEGSGLSVTDLSRTKAFRYDPADPDVDGDKDELVEMGQKADVLTYLAENGIGEDQLSTYEYSELDVQEEIAHQIGFNTWKSTIYGCYTEAYSAEYTFSQEVNGAAVNVTAPEGAFPTAVENVSFAAAAVTEEQDALIQEQLAAKAEGLGQEVKGYQAYDLSFAIGGEEVQPQVPVTVSFENTGLSTEEANGTQNFQLDEEAGAVNDLEGSADDGTAAMTLSQMGTVGYWAYGDVDADEDGSKDDADVDDTVVPGDDTETPMETPTETPDDPEQDQTDVEIEDDTEEDSNLTDDSEDQIQVDGEEDKTEEGDLEDDADEADETDKEDVTEKEDAELAEGAEAEKDTTASGEETEEDSSKEESKETDIEDEDKEDDSQDSKEEDTEALKEETEEKDTAEEDDKEKEEVKELTYEDDSVVVTVSAEKNGIIPKGVELHVVPLLADDKDTKEQYQEVEKKLQEKAENEDYEIAGFLAYDICFVDEDGKEVEPDGEVKVSMEYKEAVLPEGMTEEEAKNTDVTMIHLEEDAKGKVKEVVDMAEKDQIDAIETTETQQVEKVEVRTESFSDIVVTWTNSARATGTLTIEDQIMAEGSLSAVYKGNGTITSYKWYKSDEKDGGYTEVKKINYQGDKSNLSDDKSALYPAYDGGARKWYYVEAIFKDGTTIQSSKMQVSYYNELQNGGFESPVVPITEKTNLQYGNDEYANEGGVWKSTAEVYNRYYDKNVAIEIVHEGRRGTSDNPNPYNWYNDWDEAAYEGEQFAELNCQDAGALYQDVLTMEGTSLNYSLAHRARGSAATSTKEYDTMYLVIMPTSVAETNELETQDKLEDYLDDLDITISTNYRAVGNSVEYNQDGILVVRITSSDQAWQYIQGENGYIPTSSLTRFFFVAGRTAADGNSNKPTQGNFLDAVWFSQQLPPVADDEFSLEIKKEFEGLDSSGIDRVKNQISFTIEAKKGDDSLTAKEVAELLGLKSNVISGSDMMTLPDGNMFFNIRNQKISVNDSYEITISENNAGLSGYSMTSQVKTKVTVGSDDPVESDSASYTLQGKSIAYVTFTNTYDRSEKKTVNFTKVWDDGGHEEARPQSLDVTLQAYVIVNNGRVDLYDLSDVEYTKTLTSESEWKTSWEVPVYYEMDGKKLPIQYTVQEGEIHSDYVYKAVSNGIAQRGDGSEYIPVYADDTIVENSKKENKVSRNSTSLASIYKADNSESELGIPGHRKYIEYNPDTLEYTLNLDITGAKGEAKGADILFVIDTSASMNGKWVFNPWPQYEDGLIDEVKSLLIDGNGIIDQIFKSPDNVNSVAFVSFAGMSETEQHGWYSTNSKETLKQEINDLKATGGTNWTYAMDQASELLSERKNSNNEKVVIFLSDGAPTYTMGYDRWNQYVQTGNGSSSKENYYDDAIDVVRNSDSLKEAKIYSVYLTDETKNGMNKFSSELSNSQLINGTKLSEALTGILEQVIPTYENVEITDVLSEYVEFAEQNPSITVTKKTATGKVDTLTEGKDYEIRERNTQTGTIKVSLLKGASLDNGATYTVSFKVVPSEMANQEYAETGTYPDRGDADTGLTSADKEGFYSNKNENAQVTYTVNDKPGQTNYQKPVIQVTTHTLSYKKVWNVPEGMEGFTGDVELNVTYTDGTQKEITLTYEEDYEKTEVVPVTRKIAKVEEINVNSDYTPSVQYSSDKTQVVVTNNYSKITTSSITVQKKWELNDGGEKTPVQVALYQSVDEEDAHQYGDTIILSEENDWEHTWTDLPKSEGSGSDVKNYTYAVRELNTPAHYTSSIEYKYNDTDNMTAIITNTYDINCADEDYYIANVLQTKKISVTKVWRDDANRYGKRPDSLDVVIDDGAESYKVDLAVDTDWKGELIVPEKKEVDYTAREELESNSPYKLVSCDITSNSEGVNIIFVNELKTTSITVEKIWNDNGIKDRPESISLQLQYKDKEGNDWKDYSIINMSKADFDMESQNSWKKVISNLPTFYDYRVSKEIDVAEGYISQVDGSNNSYKITNTLRWSVKKANTPMGDITLAYLSGAEFELQNQKGDVLATGTSGQDGLVTWNPKEGINLNDLDDGVYTIVEKKAPDGYVIHEGGWKVEFKNSTLIKLDNQDVNGDSTDGVVITLNNEKLYQLPETGGSGIFLYMISGTLLLIAGSLMIYINRRKGVLRK